MLKRAAEGVPAKAHNSERSLLHRVERYLFVTAVLLATFTVGWSVATFGIFPHSILFNAYKTAETQIDFLTGERHELRRVRFVNIAPDRAETHRFEFVAAATFADPILVPGGLGRFAEHCPGHAGCLAVVYAGNGRVIHAYPYRPDEIEKTTPLVAFPYEQQLGFAMHDVSRPESISQYANGDLLVVFHSKYSFPYGLGSRVLTATAGRSGIVGTTVTMKHTSQRMTLLYFLS